MNVQLKSIFDSGLGIASFSIRMASLDFIDIRKQVLLLAALVLICISVAEVEGQTNAKERAATLRLQLAEVQAKQTSLQSQLKNLEELSKPENIEKSLAGIGSTHPEELREVRRQQFELEKLSLQSQLNILVESQTRLESSIIRADAEAYNQSAIIVQEPTIQSSGKSKSRRTTRTRHRVRRKG